MIAAFWLVAAHAQSLEVEVSGVEGVGQIGCAIFATPEGFPSEAAKAQWSVQVDASAAKNGVVVCRFDGVDAARIAVAVRHDRNGNGRLDTNFVGQPREPYGFSRDAPLRTFGPPTFDDAAVTRSSTLKVRLRE